MRKARQDTTDVHATRDMDTLTTETIAETPVLELLLGQPQPERADAFPSQEALDVSEGRSPGEIVLGTLQGVEIDGRAEVVWPGGPAAGGPAFSLVPLSEENVGRRVALSFPRGSQYPLVMGLIWRPEPSSDRWEVELDGEAISLEARSSLVLRCGRASIALTADGQILLRGNYISSHATGTQRIKGAAVRIN